MLAQMPGNTSYPRDLLAAWQPAAPLEPAELARAPCGALKEPDAELPPHLLEHDT